ncbi:MAG TPA: NADH-quinone oxidoreductase subunit N, partial [Acinetobacter sp.]|nr:NADH-quinone oxidoreductase subunit N [Acinetobacter sp.]
MNFTLSYSELMPLIPVLIVALTAVVVMLLIAIKRNHNLVATTSVVGLNLSVIYIAYSALSGHFAPMNVMNMFMVDPFTMLYQFLILIAA